jgi:hypothetical protein
MLLSVTMDSLSPIELFTSASPLEAPELESLELYARRSRTRDQLHGCGPFFGVVGATGSASGVDLARGAGAFFFPLNLNMMALCLCFVYVFL